MIGLSGDRVKWLRLFPICGLCEKLFLALILTSPDGPMTRSRDLGNSMEISTNS